MLFLGDYLPFAVSFISGCYCGYQAVTNAEDPADKYYLKALCYGVMFFLCVAGAVVALEHLDFLAELELEPVAVCETDLECELWESTKGKDY